MTFLILFVYYLNVSFSGTNNSFREEKTVVFFCFRSLVIMLFLFDRVSSSSGCFL